MTRSLARLALCLVVTTGLAGCSSGTDYKPYDPQAQPTGKGAERRLVVSSAHRYVEVAWRAGERAGSGRLVSRGRPNAAGVRRFEFVLSRVPRASVTVRIDGLLPLESHAELRLPADRKSASAAVGPQSGGCGPERPAACGGPPSPPPDGPGVVHVASNGDDAAKGDASAPFRSIQRGLAEPGVQTVLVSSGDYPAVTDERQRERTVLVRGTGRTRPRIEGAVLTGSRLHFEAVAFTRSVVIGTRRATAKDIAIANSEITERQPNTTCVALRPGVTKVELRGSWVHDCRNGMGGPFSGRDDGPTTTGVRIVGNLMERFVSDGVQFTDWRDVLITHNMIREMQAGSAPDHNDGVQIVGGSSNVRIAANQMYSSKHQLILVSDALGGPNENIVIENNLLWSAGSWAINNFGAAGMRIVNNTAWGNKAGGLILGAAPGGDRRPERDTVVANNVLDRLFLQRGADSKVRVGNVLGPFSHAGRGEVEVRNPGFASVKAHDYTPLPRSPARQRASQRYLPATDLLGLPRRGDRTAGALR